VLIKRSRARHLPVAAALVLVLDGWRFEQPSGPRPARRRNRARPRHRGHVKRDNAEPARPCTDASRCTAGSVDCGRGDDIATIDKTNDTLNACERIRYS
jgi:hypothetical protein